MWDHQCGADWFCWGGAALKWRGRKGGTMASGHTINSLFQGIAYHGAKAAEICHHIKFSTGWGTSRNTWRDCAFENADLAIVAGEKKEDGNNDTCRIENCRFNHLDAAFETRNWQSFGHVISDPIVRHTAALVRVKYGGKVTVQRPMIMSVEAIFDVERTTDQLNQFTLDGFGVDGDGDPPTLMWAHNLPGYPPVFFVARDGHTTKPNDVNPVIRADSDVIASLSNIRRLGCLCDGPARARIRIENCVIADNCVPGYPAGLANGQLLYDNGDWSGELSYVEAGTHL